jgi:hypothetical protein
MAKRPKASSVCVVPRLTMSNERQQQPPHELPAYFCSSSSLRFLLSSA